MDIWPSFRSFRSANSEISRKQNIGDFVSVFCERGVTHVTSHGFGVGKTIFRDATPNFPTDPQTPQNPFGSTYAKYFRRVYLSFPLLTRKRGAPVRSVLPAITLHVRAWWDTPAATTREVRKGMSTLLPLGWHACVDQRWCVDTVPPGDDSCGKRKPTRGEGRGKRQRKEMKERKQGWRG